MCSPAYCSSPCSRWPRSAVVPGLQERHRREGGIVRRDLPVIEELERESGQVQRISAPVGDGAEAEEGHMVGMRHRIDRRCLLVFGDVLLALAGRGAEIAGEKPRVDERCDARREAT